MTFFNAIILGIVEGITEFLPISSTGHLILTSYALGIPESDLLKSFEIAIQSGAILAVVAYNFRTLLDLEILKKLFVAFVPTAVIGLSVYSFVKAHLLGNELVVVSALFLGGILLIVFELCAKENTTEQHVKDISYTHAGLVGIFQSIAIIPGVSRSAATIIGGRLLGIPRTTIVEFSFLLAVPTMFAATGLDLVKNLDLLSRDTLPILITGLVTAFLVASVVLRALLAYVRTHTFIPFGVYRIVIALLFFFFLIY